MVFEGELYLKFEDHLLLFFEADLFLILEKEGSEGKREKVLFCL